jgi:predicted nucleic acid-binding protein
LIVAFDASVLVYLFDERAPAPIDQGTGVPVADAQGRLNHLVATLADAKAKIIIPTPALAEVLVNARDAAPAWLAELHRNRHFRIVGFDERAAIEYAVRQAERRSSPREVSRAKAKFDDQILAIAAVENAETLYSDDAGLARSAPAKLNVLGIADLPRPPVDPQPNLPFSTDPA